MGLPLPGRSLKLGNDGRKDQPAGCAIGEKHRTGNLNGINFEDRGGGFLFGIPSCNLSPLGWIAGMPCIRRSIVLSMHVDGVLSLLCFDLEFSKGHS